MLEQLTTCDDYLHKNIFSGEDIFHTHMVL
jgi:hypothetical protein